MPLASAFANNTVLPSSIYGNVSVVSALSFIGEPDGFDAAVASLVDSGNVFNDFYNSDLLETCQAAFETAYTLITLEGPNNSYFNAAQMMALQYAENNCISSPTPAPACTTPPSTPTCEGGAMVSGQLSNVNNYAYVEIE
ncbi:hypothetical protein WJX75_007345 [Coccomyxa subellipsoidea]|uniref:Pectinesterase inhibitor domain-containing protein n=1 Tax=Coccomyxa subellipsoidea TaxID=248742 RepID=A0ABR2YB72_9CHLO